MREEDKEEKKGLERGRDDNTEKEEREEKEDARKEETEEEEEERGNKMEGKGLGRRRRK